MQCPMGDPISASAEGCLVSRDRTNSLFLSKYLSHNLKPGARGRYWIGSGNTVDRGNGLEVIGWADTVAGQVVWSVQRIAQPWADVALIALRFTL